MSVGILSYSGYIPRYRIKQEEYVKALGWFATRDIQEKSVPGYDEDSITMAIRAVNDALLRAKISPSEIDALFFASTSPPYDEKLSSSTVSTAIDLSPETRVSDFGFSTKAGVDALLACINYVSSEQGACGIVVASDCPRADVYDSLEHSLGAGASAFVIGRGEIIASFETAYSITEEVLGERFRRRGKELIEDIAIAPYTQAAFQKLIKNSLNGAMKKIGKKPSDVNYVAVHQSDIREAMRAAKECGFTDSQIAPGIIASSIGDTGVASTLLGLVSILEKTKKGDRVLVTSYGSGSSSDTLSFVIEGELDKRKEGVPLLDYYIADKEYIDFITYSKLRKRI